MLCEQKRLVLGQRWSMGQHDVDETEVLYLSPHACSDLLYWLWPYVNHRQEWTNIVRTFRTSYTIGNHSVEGSSFVVIVEAKTKHTALKIKLDVTTGRRDCSDNCSYAAGEGMKELYVHQLSRGFNMISEPTGRSFWYSNTSGTRSIHTYKKCV